MFEGALSGVRVLDLTHYAAGPYCTKLLADYGADVIKIERPGEGDRARTRGPFFKDDPDLEKSGLFLFLNTNKKSMTLNLKTKTGTEIFTKLAKNAEAVVENFRPGVMAALGLDYSVLEKTNPKLVMTSISNFGQTGPYRDYKATDIVSLAMGGELYRIGEADREPVKFAGPQSQFHAGLVGAIATMSALYYAHSSGIGQPVDVSIMEAVLNIMELSMSRYPYSGDVERRVGDLQGNYPWGVYACEDGYISVNADNRVWGKVASWIGMSELAQNPDYMTPDQRLARFEQLEAVFVPWFLEHKKDYIVSTGQALGIPVIGIFTPEDMLEDPHYRARGFFVDIEHPRTGKLTYPGVPFKMSETPWQLRMPAPLLGQHNEEIYCGELGYSRDELGRLRENMVL